MKLGEMLILVHILRKKETDIGKNNEILKPVKIMKKKYYEEVSYDKDTDILRKLKSERFSCQPTHVINILKIETLLFLVIIGVVKIEGNKDSEQRRWFALLG